MKSKTTTTNKQGQLAGADSGTGWQLSCLTGVDGLAHLTDDEAERLIEWMNSLADEGFCEGWDAMSLYNHDHRLLCAGPMTEH